MTSKAETIWKELGAMTNEGEDQRYQVHHYHSDSSWFRCSHASKETAQRCADRQQEATGEEHFVKDTKEASNEAATK